MSIDLSQYKKGDRVRVTFAEPLKGSVEGVVAKGYSPGYDLVLRSNALGVGLELIAAEIASIERVLPKLQPGDFGADDEFLFVVFESLMVDGLAVGRYVLTTGMGASWLRLCDVDLSAVVWTRRGGQPVPAGGDDVSQFTEAGE